MSAIAPSIEFFQGVSEDLSNVSLRRDLNTGAKLVVMIFEKLKATEQLNSFTKNSANNLRLVDEEGEISVAPNKTRFLLGGPEGDEIQQFECEFEIAQDEHWDRFMRFMNRYAEANGMRYGEPNAAEN